EELAPMAGKARRLPAGRRRGRAGLPSILSCFRLSRGSRDRRASAELALAEERRRPGQVRRLRLVGRVGRMKALPGPPERTMLQLFQKWIDVPFEPPQRRLRRPRPDYLMGSF